MRVEEVLEPRPEVGHRHDEVRPVDEVRQLADQLAAEDRREAAASSAAAAPAAVAGRRRASSGRPAAVDQERVAGDQRRGRRGEEDDRAGDLHRLADPVQPGDPLDGLGLEDRVGQGAGRARASG